MMGYELLEKRKPVYTLRLPWGRTAVTSSLPAWERS